MLVSGTPRPATAPTTLSRRPLAARPQSRYVSEEQLPTARRQIEAGREFRQQVEAYWEACEEWADAELEPSRHGPAKGRRKKGLLTRLRAEMGAEIEALLGRSASQELDSQAGGASRRSAGS